MPTKPNPDVLYFRVRGGATGGRGVCNECRALRGVTHLRDRGFRTFRNAREPRPNTHDSKLMDLMSFVNAVAPQIKEIPWITQIIGTFEGKAHPTIASHAIAHTHDAVVYELGMGSGFDVKDLGVEPVYRPRYVRGVVVGSSITDEALDSLDEFMEWRKA